MFADELTPEQAEAAGHRGGHLLVVAGAGTGKTRTLAARVASLLAEDVDPQTILLLTFSRRAAAEMLGRVGRVCNPILAAGVWGGTFHAMAHRILRGLPGLTGLPAGFTVLDQSDAIELLGVVRAELGVHQGRQRFPTAATLAAIHSRVAATQAPLSTVVEQSFPWCGTQLDGIRDLLVAYTERKAASAMVDFEDLLLHWRALAGSAAHPRFAHVLVDEYQDVNDVQADVVSDLAATGAAVTAVGDDAQAIYGFRAGSARHLEEFPDRFNPAHVIILDRNYRSTPAVLAAANAVMADAPARFPKQLWSTRQGGPRPTLVTCADEATEATRVCDRVLELREEGLALRDQAVLFRTGHHSSALELELVRRDVPFVKYGGLRFLEAAHVKDLLCLLRVLENPSDELAWWRVVRLVEGIGPATARRVLACLGVGQDHPDAVVIEGKDAIARLLTAEVPVPAPAREGFAGLRQALGDCATEPPPPVGAQVHRLIAWLGPVVEHRYEAGHARLADLASLAGMAGASPDRATLLADLALDPPASTSDLAGPPNLDDDWLVLSTIHSAKGGEWKAVHLIHASDGNIPSDMALSEPGGLHEERRLLYVALTRARDHLTVTAPLAYHHRPRGRDDAHSWGQPSRFLSPVGVLDCFDQRWAAAPGGLPPRPELGSTAARAVGDATAGLRALLAG